MLVAREWIDVTQRPVVALVCDAIHPYSHGGRELRNHELLPRLAEYAEVHVYTMQWWPGPPVLVDGPVTYHAISKLVPMYTNNRRSIRQALHFGLASLRLLRCDFDVLDADHIPYFQLFVLRVVASLKRKPLTATWHEVWGRAYWREYLGWLGYIAWATEWLSMRLPNRIIAVSPETDKRLRQMIGDRTPITMVPNGIDVQGICSAPAEDYRRDIVVVGRLIAHKRVDMVLDLVSLLHSRGMKINCTIVGDGPERASLAEKAEALGIAEHVEFRHDIDNPRDLYSVIKTARLFMSLSTREGFGIAVLEAIGCGVPVLTTSARDNYAQHLVHRYSQGIVCEPSLDPVAMAVEEVLAVTDDAAADRRTDSWVAQYDWSTIADQVASAYFA
jgi:glycosyltransferase involved in cell wall biosynthesis